MPRKTNKKDVQAQAEILNSPVRMDGQGEDPVVQAVLSDKFVEGSNLEALQIGVALQQLIRGNVLLSQQMEKLNERMNEMDRAAERWNTDREKFVQEVLDRAESLKATGPEKDKILARAGQNFSEAVTMARAEQITDNQRFHAELEKMPKVNVVSAGELIMKVENGQSVPTLMNETVKIKDRKWILPINKVIQVPIVVAQVLEERRRIQQETQARQELLSSNLESSKLQKGWEAINKTFNSTTDTIPS